MLDNIVTSESHVERECNTVYRKFLKIEKWREILERDKLEFLRVLVPHYMHHVYFQNIVMAALPQSERFVPDDDTIVTISLKGVGGSCITKNGFLVFLLRALGFHSYAVSSEVLAAGMTPDSHVICIVELENGRKYLLDCGGLIPFQEPVPLHELPYTNTAAGIRFQIKPPDKNGVYVRVQLDGGMFGGNYVDKGHEHLRYKFTLTPRTMQHFQKPLADNFELNFFMRQPTLFRYFEEDPSGKFVDIVNIGGNRKCILIRGCSVLIADDHTKNVTHYDTYDEVKPVVQKYFSKLDSQDVENAFEHFNASAAEHGYYRVTGRS